MDFILENNILRVCVKSKGAELASVIKKETGEELLWQGDPARWNRHAPILFPYCGRLKNGAFTHDGVRYEGGQHGFARDLEHALVEQTESRLVLCLEANALTMEKFPFAFQLYSTFVLEGDSLTQRIEILNDGEETMPFGFGFHPGFVCPFDARHKAEDYAFTFELPETPEVIETGEKSGLVTGARHVLFEDGTQLPLSDHLFDHDSICMTHLRSKTLAVTERDTGRCIRVGIEGFPEVLVWSARGPLAFVCIEPWCSLPDAENASGAWTEKQAAATLAPGEHWEKTLALQFAR